MIDRGSLIIAVCCFVCATALAQSPVAPPRVIQEPAKKAVRNPIVVEIRRGEVNFQPSADLEKNTAPQFRLPAAKFAYEQEAVDDLADYLTQWKVRFPSPVVTASEKNNTVHCEYFCPTTPGKHPACVVLHILGGDFELSRLFARSLAQKGVASLFVIMPHYGPRRDDALPNRMISTDPKETVAGMTQAVLDIRRAAAWLASRDEVDEHKLGVFGISLGGITAGLAASAEPKFQKVCMMLAGGDIGAIAWNQPKMKEVRQKWEAAGGTQQSLVDLIKTVDPMTYAGNVRGRDILMLNASHDEIIPKDCTVSLWKALGEPPIVWYDTGHISAVRKIVDAVQRVDDFFAPPTVAAK